MRYLLRVEEYPYNAGEALAFAEERGIEVEEIVTDGETQVVPRDVRLGTRLIINTWSDYIEVGAAHMEPRQEELDAAIRQAILDRAARAESYSFETRSQAKFTRPVVPRPSSVALFRADAEYEERFELR